MIGMKQQQRYCKQSEKNTNRYNQLPEVDFK